MIDYAKLNKTELIAEVKKIEESLEAADAENLALYATIRELNKQVDDLNARLSREQFSHEMTVEECEKLRNDLLDARLKSYAERTKKKFYIGSCGNTVYVKTNVPF